MANIETQIQSHIKAVEMLWRIKANKAILKEWDYQSLKEENELLRKEYNDLVENIKSNIKI